jgi:hypothetical protein
VTQPAQDHHGKGEDRSHGQVDAGDDDHRRHADRQNYQHCDLIQDVQQIPKRKKRAGFEGKHYAKHHQPDEGALHANKLTSP